MHEGREGGNALSCSSFKVSRGRGVSKTEMGDPVIGIKVEPSKLKVDFVSVSLSVEMCREVSSLGILKVSRWPCG